MRFAVSFLVSVCMSLAAIADNAEYDFDSVAKQSDFLSLTKELRCVVCQNQSLHESFAPISQDLKTEIYNQVKSGNTKEEILDYMMDLYGEFILYEPVVSPQNIFLWIGPFLLLLAGAGYIYSFVRARL